MSVISGIHGAIDGIPAVLNWRINSTNDLQSFVSSNTKGGTGRIAGNGDWSGSYQRQGHTPATMPGSTFTLTGSIDGAIGVSGLAIVDSVEITIDIEGAKVISHTVNFSSAGALTRGAAVPAAETAVCPISSIGCKVAVSTALAAAAGATFADVTDVRTITITLSANNQAYNSSSTAGATGRVRGNFDATFNYTVYTSDLSTLPTEGSIRVIRFYVTATTYWQFEWGVFGAPADVEVDIEGAKPIGATISGGMTAVATISGTCTYGTLKTPAGVTVWP